MVRKKRSQERRPAVASVCRRRRRNSRTFAESSRLRLRQQKMELPPALSGAPNLTPFATRGSGITTSVGLVYQDLRTNTKVAHVQCGEQSKHPRLNVEKTIPAHVVWCRGEGVKAGRKLLYRRQGRITCHDSAEQHRVDGSTGRELTHASCCYCYHLLTREPGG